MMIIPNQQNAVVSLHGIIDPNQGDIHSDSDDRESLASNIHISANVGFGKTVAKANRYCSDPLTVISSGICAGICHTLSFFQRKYAENLRRKLECVLQFVIFAFDSVNNIAQPASVTAGKLLISGKRETVADADDLKRRQVNPCGEVKEGLILFLCSFCVFCMIAVQVYTNKRAFSFLQGLPDCFKACAVCWTAQNITASVYTDQHLQTGGACRIHCLVNRCNARP